MALIYPYIWIPSGGGQVEIVTWADGTDEQIKAMIDAADVGMLNLNYFWSVGDERIVHLSAMTADNAFTNGQPEQDVVLVLMDTGTNSGYKDVNGKTVNFVWGQKDCLLQTGKMHDSVYSITNLWGDTYLRAALNDKYYNALPASFRACLKQFNVITSQSRPDYQGQSPLVTSQEYISLFAEKEIFGTRSRSSQTEADALTAIEYYQTYANIQKKIGISGTTNAQYWERSPGSSGHCYVDYQYNTAQPYYKDATYDSYVAPFGCI